MCVWDAVGCLYGNPSGPWGVLAFLVNCLRRQTLDPGSVCETLKSDREEILSVCDQTGTVFEE